MGHLRTIGGRRRPSEARSGGRGASQGPSVRVAVAELIAGDHSSRRVVVGSEELELPPSLMRLLFAGAGALGDGFVADVVGMTVTVTEGEPPLFAMVGEGSSENVLVEVDEPAILDGAACYVTMEGLGALTERIAAAGIDRTIPLTVRPWGKRDIVVRLPARVRCSRVAS
jgi:hypothetical protein